MYRKRPRHGKSYRKRVADINRIYDEHVNSGLSNREIWRRYIYPEYRIAERTFYNMLNASADTCNSIPDEELTLFNFNDHEGKGRD